MTDINFPSHRVSSPGASGPLTRDSQLKHFNAEQIYFQRKDKPILGSSVCASNRCSDKGPPPHLGSNEVWNLRGSGTHVIRWLILIESLWTYKATPLNRSFFIQRCLLSCLGYCLAVLLWPSFTSLVINDCGIKSQRKFELMFLLYFLYSLYSMREDRKCQLKPVNVTDDVSLMLEFRVHRWWPCWLV